MEIKNIKAVYFVGIGGIGMSALARYFKVMGYEVAGYDRTPSPLTRKMTDEEGFEITYEDEVKNIREVFQDKEHTPRRYRRKIVFLVFSGITDMLYISGLRCWDFCLAARKRFALQERMGRRQPRPCWLFCCIIHTWDAVLS